MRDAHELSPERKSAGLFRKPVRGALVLFAIFVLGSLAAEPAGQQPVPNQMNRQSRNPFDGFGGNDPLLTARQMRALNADRQKSLVSDTDKLLKLAQELNSEIETGNPNMLTQVQLRKIADIERLARSVKQKMSISFVDGPQFQEPVPQHVR
ncbi:MAG TPA: hypothetical protein VMR02_17920 [Terracidiphilus sp.]|jgi:hypothetical protein|nr:hypothetical protein [Terracidiphilus sp.]